jgi:hypothetical protein
MTTVSLHVVSLPWRQAWRGLTMVTKDKALLARLDGARFAVNGRTCGGRGTRNINLSLTLRRQVVLIEWESPTAMASGQTKLDAVWSARGAEVWSASLLPLRAKGTLGRAAAFAPNGNLDEPYDTVAALTYGKVKVRRMIDFYLRGFPRTARSAVGDGSRMIAGIGFAAGLPIRNPCTFSLWRSDADVSRFAHGATSPHGDVQRRATDEGWFVESMFARFVVTDHAGNWGRGDPLS